MRNLKNTADVSLLDLVLVGLVKLSVNKNVRRSPNVNSQSYRTISRKNSFGNRIRNKSVSIQCNLNIICDYGAECLDIRFSHVIER